MIGRAAIRNCYVNLIRHRVYCTQEAATTAAASKIDSEWANALPYDKIPGPSRFSLIRQFLPGGKYHNVPIADMHALMRAEYGNVIKLRGMLGRSDMILTFDPVIFETIFRTEGSHPLRRGLETFTYYRKKVRPDVFGDTGGLLSESGQRWMDVRSKVNPVMLQPKTVKMYIEKIDTVAQELIERIRTIRDPQTLQMPNTFGHELNRWALESIGLIALDQRLGVMKSDSEQNQRVINLVKEFFVLSYELDVAPSIWKYYKTEKFHRLMHVFDEMTEIIMARVDEAVKRLDATNKSNSSQSDQSVLEKLLLINRQVAIIMVFDMILAGVDTTSAALVSCLYHLSKNPDKQDILREEVLKVLPDRGTQLTTDSLNNMPYLRAVLKEAMRLNPVIAGNARTTGRDVVLGGYQVPKGVEVAMGTLVLQNTEYYFPKSGNFIPERWIKGPENEKYAIVKHPSNSFVFLPFGFGPRSCIGRRFAEMEIFVVLSRIVREFQMEYNYGPLKYNTSITLSPDEDIKFKFIDVEQ